MQLITSGTMIVSIGIRNFICACKLYTSNILAPVISCLSGSLMHRADTRLIRASYVETQLDVDVSPNITDIFTQTSRGISSSRAWSRDLPVRD